MASTTSDQAPASPGELVPMNGLKLWLAAVMAGAANFLVLLDTTIANVSIPNISASLGASPHEGISILTSYAVADAISVCLTGWLTARFGLARTTAYAMAGFGLASLMCGLSTNLEMLIFSRIVQGIFGGPLIALSQIILLAVFPKEKLPLALAIWSTGSTMAPISGPMLGGYICDTWSWPWIFLLNVPIAALASFATWRLLRERDAPPQKGSVDVVGLGLMITWISATQYVLDHGPDMDWFESNLIVCTAIVAVVSFIAFLIWELTEPRPIVDLKIFRDRTFAICMFIIFFGAGAFYASLVLSPLWLQTNMGYTATLAGQTAAPGGGAMLASTLTIAWLMKWFDGRYMASVVLLLLAASFIWRAHFASTATMEMVMLTNVALGFAMPMFALPTMRLSLSQLAPHEIAGANGAIAFARTIAIAFATSLVTTHWRNAATTNRSGIVEQFNGSQGLTEIGTAGLPSGQALWALDGMVEKQAVMMATNDTYFVLAVMVAVLAVTMWIPMSGKAARA